MQKYINDLGSGCVSPRSCAISNLSSFWGDNIGIALDDALVDPRGAGVI